MKNSVRNLPTASVAKDLTHSILNLHTYCTRPKYGLWDVLVPSDLVTVCVFETWTQLLPDTRSLFAPPPRDHIRRVSPPV